MTLSTLRSTVLLGGSPPMALSGPAYMSTGKMIPAAQTAPYMSRTPSATSASGCTRVLRTKKYRCRPTSKFDLSGDLFDRFAKLILGIGLCEADEFLQAA